LIGNLSRRGKAKILRSRIGHVAAPPQHGANFILRLGHLSDRDFWLAASACDACINLRDPAAGETSGIAIRLMGIGKAVMLSDGEESSRYPMSACFRIARGVAEIASLTEHSKVAASLPQTTREIGCLAAGHVNSFHSLDRVADEYWETLCAYGLSSRSPS